VLNVCSINGLLYCPFPCPHCVRAYRSFPPAARRHVTLPACRRCAMQTVARRLAIEPEIDPAWGWRHTRALSLGHKSTSSPFFADLFKKSLACSCCAARRKIGRAVTQNWRAMSQNARAGIPGAREFIGRTSDLPTGSGANHFWWKWFEARRAEIRQRRVLCLR
jgi:hypothetical protein